MLLDSLDVIRTLYDNRQVSMKDFGLRASHETITNVLQKHKYSSRARLGKNRQCDGLLVAKA